jgi:hypothetical protein
MSLAKRTAYERLPSLRKAVRETNSKTARRELAGATTILFTEWLQWQADAKAAVDGSERVSRGR